MLRHELEGLIERGTSRDSTVSQRADSEPRQLSEMRTNAQITLREK